MKIHLSFLWVIFLAIAYFSHALKTFLILFGLLLIHEMAHVFTAKLMHYETGKLNIYPFGYSCEIRHLKHGKSYEEIMIVLAGLGMHLCFPLLFELAYRWDLISYSYLIYLNELNHAIFFFNCLPIYPLDGGRILDALLHFFLPYQKARKLTLIISFLVITLMLVFRVFRFPNMLLIILFLYYQLYHHFNEMPQDLLEFYFFRYQHPFMTKKNRRRSSYLYRNKAVDKIHDQLIQKEEVWLKQMFSKFK